MRVRITKGFIEGTGEALNPGYQLDVPEVKAREWEGLGVAIILPDVPVTPVKRKIEVPILRPRETAVAVKKARR